MRTPQIIIFGRRTRWLAFPLTVLLAITLAGQNAAVAAPSPWTPPKPKDVAGVVVRAAKPAARTTLTQPPSIGGPQKVIWPAAGTAEVDLTKAAAPRTTALAAADSAAAARAGTLPVRIGRAPADAKVNGKTLAASTVPGRVAVTMHDRAATQRAGASGALFTVGRADKSKTSSAVSVTLDYSGFAKAYGGDWASRLKLVQLPACAVSTPSVKSCATATPLATVNNAGAQTLTATAPLAASATVLAAQSGASGDNGDYSATDLSAAGTWQVSEQTGNFAWSLPVRVPQAPGDLSPTVSLGYSSGSVDGLTAATNTQGGWVGDGWSMWPGFIERKYASCADDNPDHKTGDQCWFNQNASLSLNGHSGELIRDGDVWRLKSDDGTKIERVAGDEDRDNGDNDNEYWKVTTTDGTQYFFGYHKLPEWTTGKAVTNSVWTVPVYGNGNNDPCYDSDFDKAYCKQAWRWNLDYVVDPHSNSMAYFYGKESGAYGRNIDADKRTTYTRGGYLKHIDYGMRKNAEYTYSAPLRVLFDSAERCKSDCWSGAAWNSKANKSAWSDTPWDQYCEEDTKCTEQVSPTFWSTRRLTKITTQKRTGTTSYADIESWTLRHDYLNAGTGESTPMWLSGVTHAGLLNNVADDPNAHPTVTDPEVEFITGAEPLNNRVDAVGDSRSGLARWRIKQIMTETGGELVVTYSPESDCDRDHLPQPDSNTTRCMPSYYSWPGTGDPTIDWFHKYVVTRIDQNDRATDQPSTTTFYDYLGDPAWHYQDDEMTKDKYKTWGDWRGYGKVRVRQGLEAGEQNVVEYQYLRGMDGDKLKNDGKRDVSVTDWGGTVVDHEALNGFLRQEIKYNGASSTGVGPIGTSTVNDPWKRGPTATRTRNDVTTNAFMVKTGKSRSRTALAAGGYRYRTTTSAFNDYGFVTAEGDGGDDNVSGDETCTRNTYAPNTGTWMLDKIIMTEKLSLGCSAAPPVGTPGTTISRTRTFYDTYTDGSSYGSPPTKGNVVRVEQLGSWNVNPQYQRMQSSVYDAIGRVTSTTDPRGYITTTDYTTDNGGLITQATTKNPAGHKLITNKEPAWGLPTTIYDANGVATSLHYDASGRLTSVWLAGRSTSSPADMKYTYNVRKTGGPTSVTSENLLTSGTTYKKSVSVFDGFLRKRQTQQQTTGGGRLLTDTFYNTRGLVDWTSQPYYDVTNAPVDTALGRPQGQIPALTQTLYDSAGREQAKIFKAYGLEKWRTTTTYGGDRQSVTPPEGGGATTTLLDVFGNTTALRQYKNPADVGKNDASLFDETLYKYDVAGRLSTMTDSAKNVWTYGYDLHGRQEYAKDPDKGITTTSYDAAGNTATMKDSLGQVLAFTYDQIGRRTSVREGSINGAVRAEWVYDTLVNGIGKQTKSIRWVGTTAYENRVEGYDTAGRPTGTSLVLPASSGALCASETAKPCTYSTAVSYKPNGATATSTSPQAAGLAKEKLTLGYNDIGQQTTVISPSQIYVQSVIHNRLGQLTSRTLGNTGSRVAMTTSFDEATGRLMSANVVPEAKAEAVNFGYDYSDAGSISKITDTAQNQTADIQCFTYDYLNRLDTARTATADNCDTAPSVSTLGASAPYWRSWQYDVAGNRSMETRHVSTGNTVLEYTYPPSGAASVQPHAVSSLKTTTGGQTTTRGFGYDNTGNTKTRWSDSGVQQTLDWDKEGHLGSLTEAGKATSFIYDADGNRLIRKTATSTTLYLPDGTEVALATGATTATATRYYAHEGSLIAMRTTAGLNWIISDHHGTAEVTIAASSLTVTKRRTLPFGDLRSNPSGWPAAMDKGFLGGTKDPTGLTHLGAREYDSAAGRFISVDPIMTTKDPTSWNGYGYANNNPVNSTDATGTSCVMDVGSQGVPCPKSSITNGSGSGTGTGTGTGSGNGNGSGDTTGTTTTTCCWNATTPTPGPTLTFHPDGKKSFDAWASLCAPAGTYGGLPPSASSCSGPQNWMMDAVAAGQEAGVDPRLVLSILQAEVAGSEASPMEDKAVQHLSVAADGLGVYGPLKGLYGSVTGNKAGEESKSPPSIGWANMTEKVFDSTRKNHKELAGVEWTDMISDNKLSIRVMAYNMADNEQLARGYGTPKMRAKWSTQQVAAAIYNVGTDGIGEGVSATGDLGPKATTYANTITRYGQRSDQLICHSGVYTCS